MITVVNKRKYDGKGVYIGRPSPLGNPFPLMDDRYRDEVISDYRRWLYNCLRVNSCMAFPEMSDQERELLKLKRIHDRKGELTLICWCKPKRCHGDVIKEILEREDVDKLLGGKW